MMLGTGSVCVFCGCVIQSLSEQLSEPLPDPSALI
jgi:hypothetical protein